MNRHLLLAFLTVILLWSLAALVAAPPERLPNKPLPPFPDGPLEDLPAPVKTPEQGPPPRLNDTNKPYDVIVVAPPNGAAPTTGDVAVGFFNHSERDLVLEINGQPTKLGSRRYLQLKLPREFDWREKDGSAQTTKVPADADGVEIVFRR